MTKTIVFGVLLLTSFAASAQTQSDPGPPQEDRVLQLPGVSMGYLRYPEGRGGLALVGFTVTGMQANGAGSAFSLQFAPQLLAESRPSIIWSEISFLRGAPIDNGWLTLKGGATGVLVLPADSRMLAGLHAGVGSLVRVSKRTGMRIDLAPHFMWGLPVNAPMITASMGLVFFPPGGK